MKEISKIKSRIDRVYVSSSLCGKILSSSFVPSRASDHKIVVVNVARDVDMGPGLWVFNNTLVQDSIYSAKIRRLIVDFCNDWQESMVDDRVLWDILKQKIMSFTKMYSKEKARANNEDHARCLRELETLEKLNISVLNQGALDRIEFLKTKIDIFQKRKVQGAMLRAKIPKFEESEPNLS